MTMPAANVKEPTPGELSERSGALPFPHCIFTNGRG